MRGYLRARDRRAPENRKGPHKTWQLVVDNGIEEIGGIKRRRQEVRSFFGTRRQAEDALRDFIDEIKKGVLVHDRRRTVEQFLTSWLEHKRLRVAHKTWSAYEMHVRRHIVPALGSITLASFRKQHVRKALDVWAGATVADRAISQRTVHHIYSTLRTALHDAHEDGLIATPPFSRRTAPTKGRAEIVALDETQMLVMLEYVDGTPLGPPTRLAALTGLRQRELLALRWML